MLKKIAVVLLGVVFAVVLLVAGLITFGPLKITNLDMILSSITGSGIDSPDESVWRERIVAPEGFSVSVYAAELPMARFMLFSDAGDLLVSRPRAGEIILLERDNSGDGLPGARRQLLGGLTRPQGMALHNGWLYIAESNAIGRVAFDSAQGRLSGEYERFIVDLPDSGNHWSKTIAFGPDGKLYLSIGSSCNSCVEEDQRRATMMRYAADGSGGEIYATGLRNSVGFDWAPWNGELYATDNGRDLLGDDFPPCELNRVVEGGFYGWPYINGFGMPDPSLGSEGSGLAERAIDPEYGFLAHNAPLGMRFMRNAEGLPERSALVALHGSWNRSSPDGYKVVLLNWQEDGSIESSDFLTGFEKNNDVIGRPVDVVQGPKGDIYVSDDYAGVIYRVHFGSAFASHSITEKQHTSNPLEGIDRENIASLRMEGANLYQQYGCAACHEGADATASRLDGISAKYDWRALVSLLETPTPPMPRFPLSAEQQRALAVYLLNSGE